MTTVMMVTASAVRRCPDKAVLERNIRRVSVFQGRRNFKCIRSQIDKTPVDQETTLRWCAVRACCDNVFARSRRATIEVWRQPGHGTTAAFTSGTGQWKTPAAGAAACAATACTGACNRRGPSRAPRNRSQRRHSSAPSCLASRPWLRRGTCPGKGLAAARCTAAGEAADVVVAAAGVRSCC